MKKLLLLTLAGLCITAAQAGLVGVGLDWVPTDFSGGVLSMDGSGLATTLVYDDSPQGSIEDTSFNMNTTLVSDFHFEGGTFELTDISNNVLLSGDVVSVDFAFALDLMSGHGEAEVLVDNLGGDLLGPSEIVTITFNIPVENFDEDFDGALSKVNFNVPEPATMALLALGGFLIRKRK